MRTLMIDRPSEAKFVRSNVEGIRTDINVDELNPVWWMGEPL